MKLTAAITQEDGWFVAQCLEVDVCSQGQTVEESLLNLKEALELYFEGDPSPEIGPTPILAPVEINLPASVA